MIAVFANDLRVELEQIPRDCFPVFANGNVAPTRRISARTQGAKHPWRVRILTGARADLTPQSRSTKDGHAEAGAAAASPRPVRHNRRRPTATPPPHKSLFGIACYLGLPS
jgi:hypothetical protein